jgi:hypothetical protein
VRNLPRAFRDQFFQILRENFLNADREKKSDRGKPDDEQRRVPRQNLKTQRSRVHASSLIE